MLTTRGLANSADELAFRQTVAAIILDEFTRHLISAEDLERLARLSESPLASAAEIGLILKRYAHILISINPEARIAAQRTSAPLPEGMCSETVIWLIRIENEGFVTSTLTVDVETSSGIPERSLFPAERLSGGPVEYRLMRLSTGSDQHLVDVTFTFRAGYTSSEPGSSAQVPLLLRCLIKK